METAPLIHAHRHLRNATHQQGKAAAAENTQAADDFAAAAQDVHNLEARRILRLLEQHHRDIARIIETSPAAGKQTNAPSSSTADGPDHNSESLPARPEAAEQNDSTTTTTSTATSFASPARTANRSPTSPRLQTPGQSKLNRDGQTSIASNLATARGINRPQPRRDPNVSLVTAHGQNRGGAFQPSPAEAALLKQQQQHPTPTPVKPAPTSTSPSQVHDERFSNFYSTMEGFFSRLTAPLAFAGLPLNADDVIASDSCAAGGVGTTTGKLATTSPRANAGVDKLFSGAALRALRNEQGGDILPGSGHVQESFMVVPTADGTMSYAGILTRSDNQPRGDDISSGMAGDEFVDAHEVPQPSSPKRTRHTSPARSRKGSTVMASSRTVGTTGKTAEELALENDTLRQLSDTLSKRLYMWETSAQERSEALQASIRTLRPAQTTAAETHVLATRTTTTQSGVDTHSTSTTSNTNEADADLQRVVKDLEAQLQAAQNDMDKVGRENDKLRLVVARYRERWEKLKEGARTRRESATGAVASPSTK